MEGLLDFLNFKIPYPQIDQILPFFRKSENSDFVRKNMTGVCECGSNLKIGEYRRWRGRRKSGEKINKTCGIKEDSGTRRAEAAEYGAR